LSTSSSFFFLLFLFFLHCLPTISPSALFKQFSRWN
jgi:hypothetical protein